jgi:hypothetical protein
MDRQCKAVNAHGKPCSAQARDTGYCQWHDPGLHAQRAEWRRQGGANRSNKARARKELADGSLTPTELHALLCKTLKAVIAGRVEPGVGNASANLARALTDVGRAAEIAERLDDLERQQATLRGAS